MAVLAPPSGTPFFEFRNGVPIGVSRTWLRYLWDLSQGINATADDSALLALAESGDILRSRESDNASREVLLSLVSPPPEDDSRRLLLPSTAATSDIEELRLWASLPTTSRQWSEIAAVQDTWANRTKYPAAAYVEGSFLRITDRRLLYQQKGGAWVYTAGRYRATLANIPTADLGVNDAGLEFGVTDYSHVLLWSGSAWGWADDDDGSDYYLLRESAPAGYGANAWALCNGATVARLNADGTTTNITLDDVTTTRYLKAALTSAGVAGRSGNTALVTPTNNAAVSGITIDAHTTATDTTVTGAGTRLTGPTNHTLTDPGHNHTQNAHQHGPGDQEFENLKKRLYYRR